MCAARENVLIVDMSVLPVRPDVGKVKEFLEKQLKLEYAEVKSIQLHNTRNCVLIEMLNKDIASRYQKEHNGKRSIVAADKVFKIPVYVDGDAVTVRIHNLPTSVSNAAIREHMIKFGEVISVRSETWKHYFPGIANGVRVLRMNLFRHIPSLITIGTDITTVSYFNQPKFCRQCQQPAHPNRNCVELTETTDAAPSTSPSRTTTNPPSQNGLFSQEDFPSLSDEQSSSKPTAEEQSQTQQNDESGSNDDDNASNSSTDFNEVTNKRRRSTQKEGEMKKVCADQCSPNTHNTDHVEEVVDTPSMGKGYSYKIKCGKGFNSIYTRR